MVDNDLDIENINNNKILVFKFNENKKIEYINNVVENTIGFKKNEIEEFQDILNTEFQEQIYQKIFLEFEEEQKTEWDGFLKIYSKQNDELWLQAYIVRNIFDNGFNYSCIGKIIKKDEFQDEIKKMLEKYSVNK